MTQKNASQGTQPKLWTKDLVLIILVNLCVFTNHIMSLSTFPFFIQGLGGTEAIAGICAAVFSFVAVIIRPFVGWWLDNGVRRAALVIGLLICPEPRQAARHPMSARPEPPGPAGRSLPLPNAPGSASCPHETMRASCSFSYPRIPRCRGPHIGVPAWRQDSTLTPCVTGMPAAHRPFASAAGVSRNQGALPGAFQISQAPTGPPSIPCL